MGLAKKGASFFFARSVCMTNYLTVQALTKYIKRKFEVDPHLRNVFVQGELSNVKLHTSGHIYFTLKDEKTRINATMFKTQAQKLSFRPENGMKVLIQGDVNVYEGYGTYQLYVQDMQPDGIGSLFVAFNQLKEQLQKEGLFLPQWKQTIPTYPKTIAVITATTGAAIRDICTTINRRYQQAKIEIYPALVQGKQAAPSIVERIQQVNMLGRADVIICGRGGGSIEDLWAFNEEVVARAIFESRIPIISAVGHETDTTIADFVADLRAPTPTAAAELAVPDDKELQERVYSYQTRLSHMLNTNLAKQQQRLQYLTQSYVLLDPQRLLREPIQQLAQLESRLPQVLHMKNMQYTQQMERLQYRLQQHGPKAKLEQVSQQLVTLGERLQRNILQQESNAKQRFDGAVRALTTLNPMQTLTRGFQVTYKDEAIVSSVTKLQKHDTVHIQFKDGKATAQIINIEVEDKL